MSGRVRERVSSGREEMLSFLCSHISKRPVNPEVSRFMGAPEAGGELEAQLWLEEELKSAGFDSVKRVGPDPKRPNVVAVLRGTGSGRPLIMNGHVDVVPVPKLQEARWKSDPWVGTVKDGRVYGRGASDMLGGVAAMVYAAKAVKDSGTRLGGDVILQCVVGEEGNQGGTIGTASVVEAGYRAPFAVVCEPTSMEVQPVTNGTFLFQLTLEGWEGHTGSKNLVAYPQPYGVPHGAEAGVDAIEKMTIFLRAFGELEREWGFRFRHPLFGGSGSVQGVAPFTITATLMEGGTYLASIPGHCKATFQVYYPPMVRAADVWADIERTVRSVCSGDEWLQKRPPDLLVDRSVSGERELFPVWEPSEVSPDGEGCRALAGSYERVVGAAPVFSGMKAVCDATYLVKKGIPAVVLGPGDLHAGVHGPNEYVAADSLVKCCGVYAEMMLGWCGEG